MQSIFNTDSVGVGETLDQSDLVLCYYNSSEVNIKFCGIAYVFFSSLYRSMVNDTFLNMTYSPKVWVKR